MVLIELLPPLLTPFLCRTGRVPVYSELKAKHGPKVIFGSAIWAGVLEDYAVLGI